MNSSWDEFKVLIKTEMMKIYSETVVDHIMDPRNLGSLDEADGFARITGPCEDTMNIWIKVKNDTISETRFMTDGCGTSIASGSMVTELARGKSIAKAQRISMQDVLGALDGLPQDSRHCALLAADTLKQAIKDYLANDDFPIHATKDDTYKDL